MFYLLNLTMYLANLYFTVYIGFINPATVSKAFDEWRYCQYSVHKEECSSSFECPCCTPYPIPFIWMVIRSFTAIAKFPGTYVCM